MTNSTRTLSKDRLKQSTISTAEWQDTARDHSTWRQTIHDVLNDLFHDDSWRERNATKPARRHAACTATPSTSQEIYKIMSRLREAMQESKGILTLKLALDIITLLI